MSSTNKRIVNTIALVNKTYKESDKYIYGKIRSYYNVSGSMINNQPIEKIDFNG